MTCSSAVSSMGPGRRSVLPDGSIARAGDSSTVTVHATVDGETDEETIRMVREDGFLGTRYSKHLANTPPAAGAGINGLCSIVDMFDFRCCRLMAAGWIPEGYPHPRNGVMGGFR